MKKGVLVGFMGLPGSGKSSLTRELATILSARAFLEPEEHEWPDCVKRRNEVGAFAGLQWFRSIRVPKLYEARALADNGEIALIDSLYDKLCASYLGAQGMEWLLDPDDPYFDVARSVAELDYQLLPDVDAVVCVSVDEDAYRTLIEKRNRTLDRSENLTLFWNTQKYFIESAENYAHNRRVPYVSHNNEIGSIQESARRLYHQLQSFGAVE